jgi:hypothetical protein
MQRETATSLKVVIAVFWVLAATCCPGADCGACLAAAYQSEVDRRLDLPEEEQRDYGNLLARLMAEQNISGAQYVLAVDRNEFVQAALLYWMSPEREMYFIGASPVSTGKPGRFEYFKTPTGIFEHSTVNRDFRAEGTRNSHGIRGYGRKGMRVFDFGWQLGAKGWGRGGEGVMRLQIHATDPDLLENRLGTAQSKGCIRIPASLNVFLDRHGILDADYEEEMAAGETFWVLPKVRDATPWSGKYLVIVDTGRNARPEWSPLPGLKGAGENQ